MQNPIKLILRALGLWLKGRLRFERTIEGEYLEFEGERFKAFRKVIVTPPKNGDTSSGAIFEVRFRFKNLSVPANRLLSLIPIPLIVAQPGFRSKTWLLGQESGDFIGYYEFETVDTAKEYWISLPLRMMRHRAAKGSLNHVIRSKQVGLVLKPAYESQSGGSKMTRKAAKTGPGAMVLVAIEQAFPEDTRIITDELASPILPVALRANVWLMQRLRNWLVRKTEQKVPGLWGGIMARKRYIDDEVTEASTGRIEAVMNLGAGFDTRAYRLPALSNIPIWEIDQPKSIAAKKSRLEKLFQQVPSHVTLVPIDFDREALPTVLESHRYAFDKRTFFIWEGVTQYLAETSVLATFDLLAKAPSGSRLIFTYAPADFIEGKAFYDQDYLYRQMVQKDKLWLFGIDPEKVEDFLGKYGWRVLEHLGYDELADRYVRPTGRVLAAMEIERIVSAEKI